MTASRLAAALVFALAAHSATAASQQFAYSYTFDTGEILSGTFFGTQNGNLITQLSQVTASVTAAGVTTPFVGSGNLIAGSYTAPGGQCASCWSTTGAVVSIDGTASNFEFSNVSLISAPVINYFYVIPWPNGPQALAAQALTPSGTTIDYYNGSYIASNWHVSAVPEPATYALLLGGLGLLAGAVRRSQVLS
jgi:hypothetical protein